MLIKANGIQYSVFSPNAKCGKIRTLFKQCTTYLQKQSSSQVSMICFDFFYSFYFQSSLKNFCLNSEVAVLRLRSVVSWYSDWSSRKNHLR